MIIVWKGWGILVGVIGILSLIVTEYIFESVAGDDNYYQDNKWVMMLGFWLAAVLIYGLYRFLLAKRSSIYFDEDASLETRVIDDHSFFFIPIKWWALIYIVLGILAGISELKN